MQTLIARVLFAAIGVGLLVVAGHLLGGCIFLPSARPVAYLPHPERIAEPLARLRATVQRTCAAGVDVRQEGSTIVFSSPCGPTERVDLAKLSRIDIVFGDWYALRLFEGGVQQSESNVLRFDDEETAAIAADSLWALEPRRESGR
ncbi:MAG: hypothetical protein JST00_20950 [Deltaproteobacteria bacterium]|nr:hypothetical protein [Deltaproteobacteria bacterium]